MTRRRNDEDDADSLGDPDEENNPHQTRFKYSTAEINDNSARNTKCCVAAMCIVCIALAIVLSVVLKGVQDDKDKENESSGTLAPTASPA